MKKRIIVFWFSIFLVFVICLFCIYTIAESDYIKSRKIVDIDWMYGKTIEEISRRYSYPPDPLEYAMGDHSPYVLCAREIFLYDPIDGMEGQYMYYALLDDEGRVIDVKRYVYGGDLPPQEYDYSNRW